MVSKHSRNSFSLTLAAFLVAAPMAGAQDQLAEPGLAELLANAQAVPDSTPEQLEDFDTTVLVTLFDAVATAAEPQPEQAVTVEWMAHDTMRGVDGLTVVPFTVTIDRSALPPGEAVVYVAAVDASAVPPPGEAPQPVWDAIWFTTLGSDQFTRAVVVEPGDYEIFVAVKGKSIAAATAAGPPFGIGRHTLSVPDYDTGSLALSSLIRFSNIIPLQGDPTPEQLDEDPYIFGVNRFVPQRETVYSRAGDIGFIFWIYGADDRGGVPDIGVEFDFNRVTADGSELFTRMEPFEFNEDNPPPFDVSDGVAIPNGAPLASFEPGEYQLVITVHDRLADETVVEEFNFSVQ